MMLNLIRKFFSKQEIPEEKIGLNEFNNWLGEKTKPIISDLNSNINQIINKVNDEKAKSAENIKKLEDAKLQNPNIPERAKIIMEGNRAAFIKKISFFFNNIDLKFDDYDGLIKKCKDIENEIDAFGKATARSYQVLNEFFAREAESMAMNVKNIESYSKEIINLVNSSKIMNIDKIKDDVANIQNKIKLKDTYLKALNNANIDFKTNKNKRLEIGNKISQIKSSRGHGDYEKLLEEGKNVELKLNNVENVLFHDFSVLEKALKKYAKIAFENEKLILKYLSNPIIALIMDNDFKIYDVLDRLKKAIEGNKLDLDDKKSRKALEKINDLDSVYFTKIKDDFKNLKGRLNALEHDIKNNDSKNELESNNNELKKINQNIEETENRILNINNELEKIDIEKLKENLQKGASDLTNAKITLL